MHGIIRHMVKLVLWVINTPLQRSVIDQKKTEEELLRSSCPAVPLVTHIADSFVHLAANSL